MSKIMRVIKGAVKTSALLVIMLFTLSIPVSASCNGPYYNGAAHRTPCATPICHDGSSLSTKVTYSYYLICSDGKKTFSEDVYECCS